MAIRSASRTLELQLQPARVTDVAYLNGLQSIFQGEISDIPDRSLLSEDTIKRRFRDFNGIAEKVGVLPQPWCHVAPPRAYCCLSRHERLSPPP